MSSIKADEKVLEIVVDEPAVIADRKLHLEIRAEKVSEIEVDQDGEEGDDETYSTVPNK